MLLVLQLYIVPASAKKNESESKIKYDLNFSTVNGIPPLDTSISNSLSNLNGATGITAVNIDGDLNDSGFRSNAGTDNNNNSRSRHNTGQSSASNDENKARALPSISPHWMEGHHVRDHKVDHSGSSFYLRIGLLGWLFHIHK